MFGWAGRILRVDLSRGRVVKEELKPAFAKAFLGGRGFNSKVLYDEFDPEIADPFSPENIVCIGVGALSGLSPSSSRVTVSVARSPITGVFGDGSAGGHFGPEMKFAGYDMLVIKGRSEKPAYLWVQDDDVEVRDARHLWGKDVVEAHHMLLEETDAEAKTMIIGPAGERLISMAIPVFTLERKPGGCGTGAVLGSKKLKAVVVRGTKGISVYDPEKFREAWSEAFTQIMTHPVYERFSTYGTKALTGIHYHSKEQPLAVKNWQTTELQGWEKQDGPYFVENYAVKFKACFACPVHCSHYFTVREGPYAGTRGEGAEFVVINNWGALIGNTDLEFCLFMDRLLKKLGMDSIETAVALAVSMHLWQDGIIDSEDTQGLMLEWGNKEAAVEFVRQIVDKKGFGALFAKGVLNGVREIARRKRLPVERLEYYVMHTKGKSYSPTELRSSTGICLAYSTSTRGADHLRGMPTLEAYASWYRGKPDEIVKDLDIPKELVENWFKLDILHHDKYEGKAHLVKYYEENNAIADALGVCKFTTSWRFGVGPQRLAKLLSAATGIEYTWRDLLRCGERIWTVEYAMQRRFGLRRKDDYPPERVFKEPIPDGPAKGAKISLEKYEKMLDEYYQIRGYNHEGIPTRQKLEELGLKDVADDLERRGILKQSPA